VRGGAKNLLWEEKREREPRGGESNERKVKMEGVLKIR